MTFHSVYVCTFIQYIFSFLYEKVLEQTLVEIEKGERGKRKKGVRGGGGGKTGEGEQGGGSREIRGRGEKQKQRRKEEGREE